MELRTDFFLLNGALLLGASLLAFVFLHYHRVFNRQYLGLWGLGFLMLALANLATGITSSVGDQLSASHPARLIPNLMASVAAYLQVYCLIVGVWQLGAGRSAMRSRSLAGYGTAIAIFALGMALLYGFDPGASMERIFFRVSVRNLLLGLAALITGFWLLRLGQYSRGFGARIVGLSFSVFGVSQLVHGTATALQAILNLQLAFAPYLSILDTVAQGAIGLGLVIWLLEQERRRANVAGAEAEFQRSHDEMTRLPNREHCVNRLNRLIESADPRTTQIVVVHLAIDRFKQVNASLGRWAGDEVLRQMAERLRAFPATNGFSGRLQSDEFVVVQGQKADPSAIHRWTNQLLATARKPFELDKRILTLDASAGIAIWPQDGDEGERLLKQADLAVQRVKSQGGRSVGFYAPELDEEVRRAYRIQTDLHGALEEGAFHLLFQPILDASGGENITGVEALIRWSHPRLGEMLPDEFLHHAREIGLMPGIDRFALNATLAEAVRWKPYVPRGFRLAVNTSAETFQSEGLETAIAAAMKTEAASHFQLEIEITEQTALSDIPRTRERVRHLRNLGVDVALDDFGTGYSSLGYLRELKTPVVKLDRAFVGQVPDDLDAAAILRAIVPMLQRLGRRVVAEGISEPRQAEFVCALGVDSVQGYHYHRPVNGEKIRILLERQARGAEKAVG